MSTKKMTTGQKIKNFRLLKGMSKSEMARRSGITFQSVYMIEERGQMPKVKTIQAISTALEVKWTDLV